jgi:hypothetical protein
MKFVCVCVYVCMHVCVCVFLTCFLLSTTQLITLQRDPGKWDPPDELQLRFMRAATASSSSNLAGLPRSTVSAAQAPPRPGHRSVMAAPRASGTSRGADNMRFVQYNLSELIELRYQ